MIKPHGLCPVTVREAADLLGVMRAAIYAALLAARRRGEPVKASPARYEVSPGKRCGKWAATYPLGSLRRLVDGQRRDAA